MVRIPVITDIVEWTDDIRFLIRDGKNAKADRDDPITFDDPVLGTFRYDRRLSWFVLEREWNGVSTQLTLQGETWHKHDPDIGQARLLAQDARRFWDDEAGLLKQCEDKAVEELLELANEWQEEHGPVSEEQFRTRISPQSLGLYEGLDFEIWFEDGDLFWGHGILVSGNFETGFRSAEMHG